MSTVRSKLAPTLSILLMKHIRGDLVSVRLPPYGLGLGLHAGHRVEDHHPAVQDPEAPLHLCCEVHVARRIYDVYVMVFPLAGRGPRR